MCPLLGKRVGFPPSVRCVGISADVGETRQSRYRRSTAIVSRPSSRIILTHVRVTSRAVDTVAEGIPRHTILRRSNSTVSKSIVARRIGGVLTSSSVRRIADGRHAAHVAQHNAWFLHPGSRRRRSAIGGGAVDGPRGQPHPFTYGMCLHGFVRSLRNGRSGRRIPLARERTVCRRPDQNRTAHPTVLNFFAWLECSFWSPSRS